VLSQLAPLALAAMVAQARPNAEDPRATVRAAALAVQGDSASRLDARLRARVARDPNDRPALLGIATLARLRYDYPAAESTYRRLLTRPDDRYAVVPRNFDLWRIDLARALPLRLTSDEGYENGSVWSPDGSKIAYTRGGRGREEDSGQRESR